VATQFQDGDRIFAVQRSRHTFADVARNVAVFTDDKFLPHEPPERKNELADDRQVTGAGQNTVLIYVACLFAILESAPLHVKSPRCDLAENQCAIRHRVRPIRDPCDVAQTAKIGVHVQSDSATTFDRQSCSSIPARSM